MALGVAPAQAQAPETAEGSAFGMAAESTVLGEQGPTLGPVPSVDCPPDDEETVADLTAPEGFPVLFTVDAVSVECSTDDAGEVVTATSTLTDVDVPGTLSAETVDVECTANGAPSGSTTIVGLVEADPDPNTEVGPLTLNRQTLVMNDDGTETLTVDGIVLQVDLEPLDPLVPLETSAEIIFGSVTCTSSAADVDADADADADADVDADADADAVADADAADADGVAEGELPRTGSDSGLLVGLGVALMAAGAISLYAVRRHQTS